MMRPRRAGPRSTQRRRSAASRPLRHRSGRRNRVRSPQLPLHSIPNRLVPPLDTAQTAWKGRLYFLYSGDNRRQTSSTTVCTPYLQHDGYLNSHWLVSLRPKYERSDRLLWEMTTVDDRPDTQPDLDASSIERWERSWSRTSTDRASVTGACQSRGALPTTLAPTATTRALSRDG